MSKIKTLFDVVHAKLKMGERYRDDDNLLVVSIWWQELEKMGVDGYKLTAHDFMSYYKDQKLTSADTITRARRKVQEECPELRGKTYRIRHEKTEEVKEDLRLF